ncbi:hypothetical protein EV215_0690 [Hypnocyclicus thermotrophus]|uniref:Outer membrane protein beta-barrel domain-containing protein n=1 Tax=Hypnocyclicus thermotrophus TaxID=1627895 RepID=A0AA46DZW4_9FUSO|nr:hypothetical protein [Hypnocyclicus thermotrophus]TDT71995.1 hypothetical protein EV215_0690 [Hypnocyclicus thermotrophus]
MKRKIIIISIFILIFSNIYSYNFKLNTGINLKGNFKLDGSKYTTSNSSFGIANYLIDLGNNSFMDTEVGMGFLIYNNKEFVDYANAGINLKYYNDFDKIKAFYYTGAGYAYPYLITYYDGQTIEEISTGFYWKVGFGADYEKLTFDIAYKMMALKIKSNIIDIDTSELVETTYNVILKNLTLSIGYYLF